MATIRESSHAGTGINKAIARLGEIGRVSLVELAPRAPHVVIHGTDGDIEFDAGGAMHGTGLGSAKDLADLMTALGWEWTDQQMFKRLESNRRYHIDAREMHAIESSASPEDLRRSIKR